MRCLERNKQTCYYALFKSKTEREDEYHNKTGEYTIVYETPVELKCNISKSNGEAKTELFGIHTDYDSVIVLDDVNCPITEDTILFFGVTPIVTESGEYNNNYIVRKVAKSLNSVAIAIKEVRK